MPTHTKDNGSKNNTEEHRLRHSILEDSESRPAHLLSGREREQARREVSEHYGEQEDNIGRRGEPTREL